MSDLVICLEQRDCEVCNSTDIWRQSASRSSRFDVTNVICEVRGSVFVPPAFCAVGISDYYSDTYAAFPGQKPDYYVRKILNLLKALFLDAVEQIHRLTRDFDSAFNRRSRCLSEGVPVMLGTANELFQSCSANSYARSSRHRRVQARKADVFRQSLSSYRQMSRKQHIVSAAGTFHKDDPCARILAN